MKSDILTPKGKLITCILPKGKGKGVMEALKEAGHTRINFAFVRGFDIHDQSPTGKLPDQGEREVLTVVCEDADRAEEVFDFIFEKGELDQLGGGLMYMSALSGAIPYMLPTEVS